MKLALRYGLAALLIVVAIILLVPPFAGSLIEQWSKSDVKSRSVLAFNSSLDEFTSLLNNHNSKGVVALFEKMAQDEELLAVGFCDNQGALVYKTKEIPKSFTCEEATLRKTPTFSTVRLGHQQLLLSSFPIGPTGERGHVVLVHDLALVEQRGAEARIWTIVVLIGVVFLAAAFAALVAVLLARRWAQSLRRAIDDVRLGGSGAIAASELTPFAGEFRHLLRDLKLTELPADSPDVDWSPAMLQRLLAQKLPDTDVIVVSNREPYIHNREGRQNRSATAGERAGCGGRADHARLWRHLDRSWQRQRGQRNRRPVRSHPRAAGKSKLRAASGLAERRGTERLLLRPGQ